MKLAIPSQSELLWWEKIGKVVSWAKLAIPSESELLRWKKIGKVVNQAKKAVPSHSVPLLWEKIGKVANQQNWLFEDILSCLVEKDWKSCKSGKFTILSQS